MILDTLLLKGNLVRFTWELTLMMKFVCCCSHIPTGVSASKDRLLNSEIAELQSKVQALLKDNHELRKELIKVSGTDPSRLRSGRKVCYSYVGASEMNTLVLCACSVSNSHWDVSIQQTLIEMYTDILNLLTEFDAKSSRKEGKFINTLPQVNTKSSSSPRY